MPGMQGIIQSAFLYGYMGTQLLGGTLADRVGGKRVMAFGIAAFSATSLLMPAALSAAVRAPLHIQPAHPSQWHAYPRTSAVHAWCEPCM